ATEGLNLKPPSYSKCIFTEGGVKCGERALPVTRHCRKHILEDPNQVLFRACSKMGGDIECTTPVEAIFDDATCRLHLDVPPLRSYSQIRKDSESDYDESLEQGPSVSSHPSVTEPSTSEIQQIKTEISENVDESSNDLLNNVVTKIEVKEETETQDSLESSNLMPDSTEIEMGLVDTEQVVQNSFTCDTKNCSNDAEADDCINFSGIMDVSDIPNTTEAEKIMSNDNLTTSLEISVQNPAAPSEASAMEVCQESFTDDTEVSILEKTIEENIPSKDMECEVNSTSEINDEIKMITDSQEE
ncbi:hypothetical protein ILUMI_04106, partial [Ignelater luminosus]